MQYISHNITAGQALVLDLRFPLAFPTENSALIYVLAKDSLMKNDHLPAHALADLKALGYGNNKLPEPLGFCNDLLDTKEKVKLAVRVYRSQTMKLKRPVQPLVCPHCGKEARGSLHDRGFMV